MISRRHVLLWLLACVTALSLACRAPRHYTAEPPPPPPGTANRNVVVWISVDGFRQDYVDRNVTPFIRKLMREGVYSQKLVPSTPSLTFPSHMSEATGAPASVHGIPSNEFYDAATRQTYKMPDSPSLPQAEPIWATAHRQGVRTLVYDWPMSYRREGEPARADVALDKFDPKPSDPQRLARLLDAWHADSSGHDKPLRLLMGYIKAPDGAGHKYGPDAPQLTDAVHETDSNLQAFVDGVVAQFNRQRVGDEQLYVVISTDHGMAAVKTLVNVRKLFVTPPPETVRIITTGPLAMVYLDQVPPHDRDDLTKSMLAELKKHDFLSAYTHDTLPKSWRLDHPSRVGEITIMLEPGYSFSTKHEELTYAVRAGDEPQGMHGFPADKSAEMRGLLVIWRYPAPLAGRNLGTVHGEQLHPTAARLLGIHPSDDAKAAAVLER